MKPFSIVVALDEKNGIGKNNDLAWRLSPDLKRFKEITTKIQDPNKQNAVIMGRKTWDSLPEKFKPLPDRLNVVLTRNTVNTPQGVEVFSGLEEALQQLSSRNGLEKVFVIGGAQIFTQAIMSPACEGLYVTHLKGDFSCDVFFPQIPAVFKEIEASAWQAEGPIQYRFAHYKKLS